MKFGLSKQTHDKIYSVLIKYPQIEKVVLYGSRARDDYRNGSDIDFTLYGGAELTHTVVSQIAIDLDDQMLPYTIDLSIFDHIRNPDMINEIERDGKVFYNKLV
ncbi:nucleotidyltransferase domain-containing protein [Candidatus Poribacteria bacterium]|nr:nucleotidyltransferase domain-containing protein [Candidatus Poribacteria bacterium]